MRLIEISISWSRRVKGHTEYEIKLITDSEEFGKNYVHVYKRYSEFLVLHKKIKRRIPYIGKFPGKVIFNRFSRETVEMRREWFEKYLKDAYEFIIRNGYEKEAYGQELIRFIQY